jgi:lipopolysaccharide export system permease protein
MKVWQKYIYKEILISYLFILSISYALYILFDLMIHLKQLHSLSTWHKLVEYYLCMLSKRLHILVSFTILIGSIRTLLKFQFRNELVALLASGISLKKLLQPFIVVSLLAAFCLYANYEFTLPYSLRYITLFEEQEFGKKAPLEAESPLAEIILKDSSKIIYRAYDTALSQFCDVFWVISADKIYYAKTLSCAHEIPKGTAVFEIARNSQGNLEKTHSYKEFVFENMPFQTDILSNSLTATKFQPLSQLTAQCLHLGESYCRAQEVRSAFFFKLCFPLMCLLVFFAPAPYCLRFRKTIPFLMIYLLSIAAFFCFLLLLQASLTLSQNHTIPAWLVIGTPWCVAFYFSLKKYATL